MTVCVHGKEQGDCSVEVCKEDARLHWDYKLQLRHYDHNHNCCIGCRTRIEALERAVAKLTNRVDLVDWDGEEN